MSASLLTVIEAAELPNPPLVQAMLEREHAVTTKDELVDVLSDPDGAMRIRTLWRIRLRRALGVHEELPPPPTHGINSINGSVLLRCRVTTASNGPELLVMHGDLAASTTDAIVNPANAQLLHGGGLAQAIVRKGGSVIQEESSEWIRRHGPLDAGSAMATSSGRLPCQCVIHTVGPNVSHVPQPTPEHAQQLRDAVWNALVEATRLGLRSVAIPGISTGIFGYPRDLGANEIVHECVRFCREREYTTIRLIALMNTDDLTVSSFVKTVEHAAQFENWILDRPLDHNSPRSVQAPIQPQSSIGSSSADVWPPHPLEETNTFQRNSGTSPPRQSKAGKASRRTENSGGHKAGGVLLARVTTSGLEVLLGVEFRPMDGVSGHYVSFLGGKIEHGERPVDTAAREFSEEVGGVFKKREMVRQLSNAEKSEELWLPFAKYMLYISHWDADDRADTLPEKYAKRKTSFLGLGCDAEHDYLVWMSWDALVKASLQTQQQQVSTPFGKVAISPMLGRYLADFQTTTTQIIDRLVVNKIVEDERARIQRLRLLNDADLINELMRSDWKLALTSPPLPPPAPIQVLQPSDQEYKHAMNALPEEISSRVVSVRRVDASARISDYKAELMRIQATKSTVSEKEPLYHGTPERWRATAIALNGFDLSIRLSGRSHGDGVYSSPNANIASGYSSEAGSLLHLRGIVAANSHSRSDNTILSGNDFYIFPNPRCLLPLTIIDFAAADSRDSLEMERNSVQDDYKTMLEKRKALEASMKKQETVFCCNMATRLRHALKVYSEAFEEYDQDFRAAKNSPTSIGEIMQESNRSSLRRLLIERQQFATCLPIYEVKHKIAEVLQRHQVVILTADTGSGKSTQLPQILMDNVLAQDETRRIAVLQPRRVNAVSLSKRVAQERGLPHGQEVGYRIGRGESNVSETTRVEYMTHGLFVQIARDCDELLAKYCVVIVDEAHERSVDVDLSLALLKRALQKCKSNSNEISFRVVVTSATIEEEANHFQTYLDSSMLHSAAVSVQGRAFPVHIEHRPDVQVDPQAVGTAGVGKVLTSTAIQTAMDILRMTETGNILIFLPGEGSINDALEVARQDILMTTNSEETSDISLFGSSTAFCFRMTKDDSTKKLPGKKSKKDPKDITVCILAFHGKISRAQRDHVLNPPPDQRFVVFSTNLAETGVTLPNVRYVIDTGLERRVRWNAEVDVNEMVTEPVTLSSMKQRAGRAGRTASGICIRLFPENEGSTSSSATDTNNTRPSVEPAVQNSLFYKALLLDKHMQQVNGEELEMMDPIDPSLVAKAEARLRELGALDEGSKLTREGNVLLSLGVDLRLGRFLIACCRFGCLATGTKLASLLVASDCAERLLPHRNRLDHAKIMDGFIDQSGDHLTLLNIIAEYDGAVERHEGMKWCREYGFDEEVFTSAESTREYLLKVLDRLQFDLVDDTAKIEQNGGIASSLRRALCSAYFDQIAAARAAGVPVAGFTRILDTVKRDGVLDLMTDFAGRTQPRESPTDCGDNMPDLSDPIVKSTSYSALWLDQVSQGVEPGRLVIFGSQMLTDGSKRAEPTVQFLSYVTKEEVTAGAPEWCRLVDFNKLLQSSARETFQFELSNSVRRYVVMDRGAWLKQLRRYLPAVTATVEKNTLVVTCPRRMSARVELEIKKKLRLVEAESVTLQLPGHVKIGKIIGKSGQNIKALEENIQTLLSSEQRGVGHRHVDSQRILSINSDTREITITLVGEAKALMSVIVGRIQSLIVQTHGDVMLPLIASALGNRGQEMQQFPRLAQLLNSVPPPSWQTRDDIMLQLAHALIWKCDVSIYGGFLRDWVIRGEPANDIDVQVVPPQTTILSVEQKLQHYLTQIPGAVQHRVQISSRKQKGSALALSVSVGRGAPIDIDLVDPSTVHQKTHPGVDCDAGNLLLNRGESLRKKVVSAGNSLASALENVRKKQFVFYYPLHTGAPTQTMAVSRLKKYLGRGWTCLSAVPSEVIQGQLTDAERQLIKPRSQG
ncbi:hypothetical protein PHYBOEH_006015 [Phytophthora boehmeriae]|uniref:Uncharacterized protein n=1 Tax=Phytophthora boehmeriae TaxID=109152 RepID=A0A8T1WQ17_9STRA|nr:hypothetical protein PHYBOEH_006015 [Phytophthora boehmeriae]